MASRKNISGCQMNDQIIGIHKNISGCQMNDQIIGVSKNDQIIGVIVSGNLECLKIFVDINVNISAGIYFAIYFDQYEILQYLVNIGTTSDQNTFNLVFKNKQCDFSNKTKYLLEDIGIILS